MMFYVYILKTSGNTLYVGQTNNIEKRMTEHKTKTYRGAKYLRLFDSFELVYKENLQTRSEALKREHALKKLSHSEKQKLICKTN